MINTIKLLIYKENPGILEKVDFDNDSVFLDPLLFAYFNSKKYNNTPNELLQEIMQGSFSKQEPLKIQHSYNKNKLAYLSNLGYYKNKTKTDTILVIDEFEILKDIHPLIEKYFIEFKRGQIINKNPAHNSVWKDHYKELEKSIFIIKTYLPNFYKELVFANKKIYLHDNPKILNFTTIETLGLLYFYVLGNNNIVYFIEELIHQGHIIIYII